MHLNIQRRQHAQAELMSVVRRQLLVLSLFTGQTTPDMIRVVGIIQPALTRSTHITSHLRLWSVLRLRSVTLTIHRIHTASRVIGTLPGTRVIWRLIYLLAISLNVEVAVTPKNPLILRNPLLSPLLKKRAVFTRFTMFRWRAPANTPRRFVTAVATSHFLMKMR